MPIDFVTGKPALLIGRALVIADLHIGAERDYRAAGIAMPSKTPEMGAEIAALIRQTRAKRLIILGDVKHRVAGASFQEERELPAFLGALSKLASLELVPGNHDGGIGRVFPGIKVHPSEGMMLGDCYLTHGHSWPNKKALEAETIITGHNHPQLEFRDRLGKRWRERAWIRAQLRRKPIEKHYGKTLGKLPGLLLMPAFGSLVGGWALNRSRGDAGFDEGHGPITRCADLRHAVAYMLDGTLLGEVRDI
jgi:putative SbcD/Mre11-related phosphoesterase